MSNELSPEERARIKMLALRYNIDQRDKSEAFEEKWTPLVLLVAVVLAFSFVVYVDIHLKRQNSPSTAVIQCK